MANHKNERAELKEKINELNHRIKDLEARNHDLVQRHVVEAKRIIDLEKNMESQIRGLQEAMTEIYCKSICHEYGEDVYDDETGEYLGKRLVFKALRKNDWKLNMSDDLIFPEDEKYISTITIGLTCPQKGEEDEDQQV